MGLTNVSNWMSYNVLALNPSKTEFLIFGLPQQLSKLKNPTIHLYLTTSYSHMLILLAFLVSSLKKNLSLAQHITAISISCFHNIRDLRSIRNNIDQTTACTIATSLKNS